MAFCIQKKMVIAPAILHLDQMGQQRTQQPLALALSADGNTAQGIAKAAAGGRYAAIAVQHGAGIVQVGVQAQPRPG